MPQLTGMPLLQNLEVYRIIGKNVKEVRKEIPMTQLEFAYYLGICNESLSKIESGKNRTEYALLKAIADIFGTSTDDLAIEDKYLEIRNTNIEEIRLRLNIIV